MATAWQKAFQRIFWKNRPNTSTPLGESKLLPMDAAIDEIDDRVVNLRTTKAEQSDLLLAFKNISFNSQTGVFTITKFNDTTITIDTDIEKIAVNFDYDDDPTSAHYQSLIITLDDGTVKYVDMSALLTQYEFTDTSTIHFSVTNGNVSANIINGSITTDYFAPSVMAAFTAQVNAAEGHAEDSEAWAIGKKNGTDVPSTADQYHNNAKYYSEVADDFSEDSEAWAKGTRDGVDVGSSDPTYHNNSKYYAEQAEASLANTVRSFNLRTGAVTPADGDYDISQIAPTSGATAGQIPILVNNGTTQEPNLEFEMQDIPASGHTVENASGTDMTKRTNLQFADAKVTDDSTNDRTKVNVLQDAMSLDDFLDAQNLDDGIYPVTEDDNTVLSSDMISHGNGTVEQAIDGKVSKSDLITRVEGITLNNGSSGGYYAGWSAPSGYIPIAFAVDWTTLALSEATSGISFYLGYEDNGMCFIFSNQQLSTSVNFRVTYIKV